MTWNQIYDPVGGNIGLSALVATIPLLILFYTLDIKRMKGHLAGLLTLGTALIIAVAVYGMPVSMALSAAGYGIANGLFPIGWVVFTAVFLYNLTVDAGQFDVIKSSISSLTDDRRLQAIFIAFCFGAFLEGAVGFGIPVAIDGAILTGLGFNPLYAAGLCLLANTGPVAFGGIGIPIITAAKITGISEVEIGKVTAQQLFLVSLLTPTFLAWVISGFRGAKEVLPATLLTGGIFAVGQLAVNTYSGPMLANIVSSIVVMGALAALLKAWMPFALLTVFVSIWGYKPFASLINDQLRWVIKISVLGLDQLIVKTAPIVVEPTPYEAVYKLAWFVTPGTAILFAAIATMFVLGIRPARFAKVFMDTFKQLQIPFLFPISRLDWSIFNR